MSSKINKKEEEYMSSYFNSWISTSVGIAIRPLISKSGTPDIGALLLVDGKPIAPVPMGAYLAVVPKPRTKADEDLPPSVRNRLRDIGYIVKDESDAQTPE